MGRHCLRSLATFLFGNAVLVFRAAARARSLVPADLQHVLRVCGVQLRGVGTDKLVDLRCLTLKFQQFYFIFEPLIVFHPRVTKT